MVDATSEEIPEPTYICLRHWLTGKYLTITNELYGDVHLSNSMDEFLYSNGFEALEIIKKERPKFVKKKS